MSDPLGASPLLLRFVVLAVGCVLGRVRMGSVSLGGLLAAL